MKLVLLLAAALALVALSRANGIAFGEDSPCDSSSHNGNMRMVNDALEVCQDGSWVPFYQYEDPFETENAEKLRQFREELEVARRRKAERDGEEYIPQEGAGTGDGVSDLERRFKKLCIGIDEQKAFYADNEQALAYIAIFMEPWCNWAGQELANNAGI